MPFAAGVIGTLAATAICIAMSIFLRDQLSVLKVIAIYILVPSATVVLLTSVAAFFASAGNSAKAN